MERLTISTISEDLTADVIRTITKLRNLTIIALNEAEAVLKMPIATKYKNGVGEHVKWFKGDIETLDLTLTNFKNGLFEVMDIVDIVNIVNEHHIQALKWARDNKNGIIFNIKLIKFKNKVLSKLGLS